METDIKPMSTLEQINAWQNIAMHRFDVAGPYFRDYYDGYATACQDVLTLMKAEQAEIIEEAIKNSHKIRNTFILGVLIGGTYIGIKYKDRLRRQATNLFLQQREQKDD